MANRPAARKSSGRGTIAAMATLALVAGAALVTVPPICLVFAVGMLPTVTAVLVDRDPRYSLAWTVGVMNLAGMTGPVLRLLQLGISMANAEKVLLDPFMWLAIYGASILGWLLHLSMPWVARVILDLRAAQAEHALEKRARALVEEWGDEVDPG